MGWRTQWIKVQEIGSHFEKFFQDLVTKLSTFNSNVYILSDHWGEATEENVKCLLFSGTSFTIWNDIARMR